MREKDDSFLITQLHGQTTRASDCYRGVWKARKAHQERQSSLLGNSYSVSAGLSTPALTWFSLGNTCSDASESPPGVRVLGERLAEGTGRWDSIPLRRIKSLPKQQEVALLGTESNFKVRFILGDCEYQD